MTSVGALGNFGPGVIGVGPVGLTGAWADDVSRSSKTRTDTMMSTAIQKVGIGKVVVGARRIEEKGVTTKLVRDRGTLRDTSVIYDEHV
ncbi:MAG: hypothetical protein ACD_40C00093G0001 [uncultured bacterium]|nr:MAG: hypothetical protein ACD_40C00093G0001 [uncultured bacterium]